MNITPSHVKTCVDIRQNVCRHTANHDTSEPQSTPPAMTDIVEIYPSHDKNNKNIPGTPK